MRHTQITYLLLLQLQLLLEVSLNLHPTMIQGVRNVISRKYVEWLVSYYVLVLIVHSPERSSSTDWLLIWLALLKTEHLK